MPEPKTIDLSVALKRMGGNVELLAQVIGFFVDDAPGLLASLKAARAAGNGPEVKRAAHSLKGLVVNFDAEIAAAAALKVESLSSLSDSKAVDAAIRDLEEKIACLMEVLPAEIRKFQPAGTP